MKIIALGRDPMHLEKTVDARELREEMDAVYSRETELLVAISTKEEGRQR